MEKKDIIVGIIKDNEVRKGLDSFTSPLDKDGYDKIEVLNEDEDMFHVTAAQRPAFKYVPPDITEEEPYQDTVSIIYLSPELSKWKFQGKRIFWADVYDEEFLKKTKDKRFSELKGRQYFVSGTKITTRNDGKIKGTPTYTIDKALEVPEQLSIL